MKEHKTSATRHSLQSCPSTGIFLFSTSGQSIWAQCPGAATSGQSPRHPLLVDHCESLLSKGSPDVVVAQLHQHIFPRQNLFQCPWKTAITNNCVLLCVRCLLNDGISMNTLVLRGVKQVTTENRGAGPAWTNRNMLLFTPQGCKKTCLQLRRKRGPFGPGWSWGPRFRW